MGIHLCTDPNTCKYIYVCLIWVVKCNSMKLTRAEPLGYFEEDIVLQLEKFRYEFCFCFNHVVRIAQLFVN